MHARPARRRAGVRPWARWTGLATLAVLAPCAHGAAFLPGAEADPATGPVTTPAPAGPVAEEPLRGNGIQWRLAPWRHGGTLGLDLRWLRTEDGSRSQQALLSGDIDFASHVWQPWFIQLRFGLGMVGSSSRGDALGPGSEGSSLVGRASISVFPASRFPFELRADVGDSRTSGLNLGGDYRSRRLSMSQGWRPARGNDSYQLQVDHSQLLDGVARDTLTVVNGSGVQQRGDHTLEAGLNHSDNHRSDSDIGTRLSAVNARHSFHPASALQVETLASWNEVRLSGAGNDSGSDVRQLSTLATWRVPSGRWTPGAAAPLVAGTARWVDARALGREGDSRVQAFNATLGATQDLSPEWRVALSANASRLNAGTAAGGSNLGLQGSANWSTASRVLAGWRYTPMASAHAGYHRDASGTGRQRAGLQLAHGASRDFALAERQLLALSLSQSGAVLHESGPMPAARALSHSASLAWHGVDDTGGQSYAGASVSDSLSWGASRGRFQLVNLQFNQRAQLGRHASWSASLTAQATRNDSSEIDAYTGQRRELGDGWQRYYSGSLSYEHQRAFGVPRLRHSVQLGVNSQPLASRALGDIDAPRERITESLETRLDYAIGRLDTRLAARVARVEGRTVAGVQARAQRRF